MKKNAVNRGITLISLIITIIIMLILLGVTVNVVINGDLIGTTQDAVGKYNNKVAKDQSRVDELTGVIGDYIGTSEETFSLYIGEYDSTNGTWNKTDCLGTFEFQPGETFEEFIGTEQIEHEWYGSVTGVIYDNVTFWKRPSTLKFGIFYNNGTETMYYNEIYDNGEWTNMDLSLTIEAGATYMIRSVDE